MVLLERFELSASPLPRLRANVSNLLQANVLLSVKSSYARIMHSPTGEGDVMGSINLPIKQFPLYQSRKAA